MRKQPLRILCPNRHLGFMMAREQSFWEGTETKPDYYCCNSGSSAIGPGSLGSDTSASLYTWQKHDLELMLLASRKQDVPMIIGSSGDTGTNSRVDLYVNLIQRLARQYNLAPFKLIYFYSEVPKETVRQRMEQGIAIEGLGERKNLTVKELEQTDRIVAVADVQPFIKALELGADVIIGGRSDHAAVFASAAIYEGFPEHISYSLGKVLDTASICAEPPMANETIIGTITPEDVKVTTMRPKQPVLEASIAGQSICDHSSPQVFGSPDGKIKVTLEGSGKVGERFITIVGIKDPSIIHHIDKVIEWVRSRIVERFSEKNYQLSYKIYGKDGGLGDLKRVNEIPSHELGIVIEGIAETEQIAEEITVMGSRQLFSTPLPGIQEHMETATIVTNGVLPAPPAYRWTIHHTLPVDDPMELFEIHELVVK